MTAMPRFTLAEIEAIPTIHQGQYDNLKISEQHTRVWLSRLTVEDGQPYNNQVTVERLEDGCWITVDEYKALSDQEARLEELRDALRAENMSYGEIAELQSLAEYIEEGDVELLEAAGVPEFSAEEGS